MKFATKIFAVALLMFPLLASAQLAAGHKIVSNVPCEFVVGNKIVPAGDLTIQLAGVDGMTLAITNRDANVALYSHAVPGETTKAERYELVFHKYGDRTFLSAMTLEGSRFKYELPVSKAESELRAQNVPATEEIQVASLR